MREAGREQQLVLAINRSDYMLDQPSGRLLQVPYRTAVPHPSPSPTAALLVEVNGGSNGIYFRSHVPFTAGLHDGV